MGTVPKDIKPFKALSKFGNQSGLLDENVPKQLPNGIDHYWDEYPVSDGNCWYDNEGPDGTRDSLTADPPLNPLPGTSIPGFLPEDCASSAGSAAYAAKAVLLLECFGEWESGTAPDGTCTWFDMPSRPGTRRAAAEWEQREAEMKEIAKSPEAKRIKEYMQELAGQVDLGPGD
jgi:hypothetical protein